MQEESNQLQEANKGALVGNIIIDTVCVFFIYYVIEAFYNLVYSSLLGYYPDIPGIILYLIYILYFLLFEYFMNATPGKLLTKTIVRNFDGSKPSFKRILLRSVLRTFPHDQLSFLFGSVGLHDLFSKTKVVYK